MQDQEACVGLRVNDEERRLLGFTFLKMLFSTLYSVLNLYGLFPGMTHLFGGQAQDHRALGGVLFLKSRFCPVPVCLINL